MENLQQADDRGVPSPLVVAASLAAIEGAFLVGYAGLELVNLSSDRLTMGLTTSIFFAVYGLALAACAWWAYRGSSWARAPIVLAQLIQLGVASSFWGGATTMVAVFVGVVALLTIAGILHPDSIDYLAAE